MPHLGIDFGTTNSLAISYDKNAHEFHYFSKNGSIPEPVSSTLWYHDDKIIVGNDARRNIYKYADVDGHHFEKSIKSFLGTDVNKYIFGKAVKPTSAGRGLMILCPN